MKRKGEEGKIRGGNLGGSRIVGLLLGLWVEAQPLSDHFIKWVRDPQPIDHGPLPKLNKENHN